MLRSLRTCAQAFRACRQWFRSFRVELWYAEGHEKGSRFPISILFAAADQDRDYLLRLIFGDSHRERCVGRYWLWNLQKAISRAPEGCSLVIIQIDEFHLKFAHADSWSLIPTWLLGQVDLPYEQHVPSKVKGELRRRIRRNDFKFEVTRDPEAFDDFYHQMYIPHIKQAYDRTAIVESYEEMKANFFAGELLLVKNQEQFIAGQLMRYTKEGPFLWQLGIRDGNRAYVQAGVAAACYHFCLQYLHEQGHKKAFLGWSRAFLNDGVLRFKKSLFQRIVPASNPDGFALRILSLTPATTAFVSKNPFIFQHQGCLYGAVFADTPEPLSPKQLQEIHHEYFHSGLARLFSYDLRGKEALALSPIPTELTGIVELRHANQLLTPALSSP